MNNKRTGLIIETNAVLSTLENFADLYVPQKVWKELTEHLNLNTLTVILRSMQEYHGKLKQKETTSIVFKPEY